MHGRLRTAIQAEDSGVLDIFISFFKKPLSPPLINEKYYVLTVDGVLQAYQKWDSPSFKIVVTNFAEYEIYILTPLIQIKRYPGTNGVVLELKNKMKETLAFAVDTHEEAQIWHN